ncbi:MAG: BrnT family toxin [Gemmatales bacterium]
MMFWEPTTSPGALMIDGFEWDPIKAENNLDKHGVSFDEAATVFVDFRAFTIPDPDHSNGELREILLGRTLYGQLIVVSFTVRRNLVRIISARKANRRERKLYEKAD